MVVQVAMLVDQRLPVGVAGVEAASLQPDALDAAAKHERLRRLHLVDGELQARRAAVDRQHAPGIVFGHGRSRKTLEQRII